MIFIIKSVANFIKGSFCAIFCITTSADMGILPDNYHVLAPRSPFWIDKAGSDDTGRAFSNRASFRYISTTIGKYLQLGISEHTLIPEIKRLAGKAELEVSRTRGDLDPILFGAEIDELTYDHEENAYYLPVYRHDHDRDIKFFNYYYKFHIDGKSHDPSSGWAIPLPDGNLVYVEIMPKDFHENHKTRPMEYERIKDLRDAKEANRILDLFFRKIEETGEHNIGMDNVMEELYKLGYDHFTVSHVWNILRKYYPPGAKPPAGDELRRSREEAALLIQNHLSIEKVFRSVFRLTARKEAVRAAEVAKDTGLDTKTVREIVGMLQKTKRLGLFGGNMVLRNTHIIWTLAEREYEINYHKKGYLDREKLYTMIMKHLKNGVYRDMDDWEHKLNARELYAQALAYPFCVPELGDKTYFGRDEKGLMDAVLRSQWSSAGGKDEWNILFFGTASGEQAYDAAARIVEELKYGDQHRRVNIICTDLAPSNVDEGAKRMYSYHNASGGNVEKGVCDGHKEDVQIRISNIIKTRDRNSVRFYSAEEFAQKWDIHFQFQVLDVLDGEAVKELAGRMRFDLIVGSNVHYGGQSTESKETFKRKNREYFEHARMLLKPRGLFHYNYAEDYEPYETRVESTTARIMFEMQGKGTMEKDRMDEYASRDEKLTRGRHVSDDIMGYYWAGWLKEEYAHAEDKNVVIREFLDMAISPQVHGSVEGIDAPFALAFAILALDKDLYDEGLLDALFSYFANTRGWGFLYLCHVISESSGALEPDNLQVLLKIIRDGLLKHTPSDFDVEKLYYPLSIAMRFLVVPGLEDIPEKLAGLFEVVFKIIGPDQEKKDRVASLLVTDTVSRMGSLDDKFGFLEGMAGCVKLLRERGLITRLYRKDPGRDVYGPDWDIWKNVREDVKREFPDDIRRKLNAVQNILHRIKKKVGKDFVLGQSIYQLTFTRAEDIAKSDRGSLNEKAFALMCRFYLDSLENAVSMVKTYEEMSLSEKFFGEKIDTFDLGIEIGQLIREVTLLKEMFGSEKEKDQDTRPLPEKEKIRSTLFSDAAKLVKDREKETAPIVYLGTSWIKGYDGEEGFQHAALNPLIGSIRKFLGGKGIDIRFEAMKDEELLSAVREARETSPERKIIVLGGADTLTGKTFREIREDKSVFLAGVDNRDLTADSYIRLVEMLTVTMRLAFGLAPDSKGSDIPVERRNGIHIFVPEAEPMDLEIYREIYRLQIFA